MIDCGLANGGGVHMLASSRFWALILGTALVGLGAWHAALGMRLFRFAVKG
jgi:hypothetical protein